MQIVIFALRNTMGFFFIKFEACFIYDRKKYYIANKIIPQNPKVIIDNHDFYYQKNFQRLTTLHLC